MNDLEELMTARHLAYQNAFTGNFQNGVDVLAWREANRAYTTARRADRAALMPSLFIGTAKKPHAKRLKTLERCSSGLGSLKTPVSLQIPENRKR